MDTHQIQAASLLPIPKLAFTIKETEYSLGISKRTLNRLIADGRIRSVMARSPDTLPDGEPLIVKSETEETGLRTRCDAVKKRPGSTPSASVSMDAITFSVRHSS
jgi:hypothetical protein